MKDYKPIEKNLIVFGNMVCDLTESILDEHPRTSEISKSADNLATVTGAWSCRCDCFGKPLTPHSDLIFATDARVALADFKEAIINTELTCRAKLLDGIREAATVLMTLMQDIDLYLSHHEDNDNLDNLTHQIKMLFKQYGILAVRKSCLNLASKLSNRALVEKIIKGEIK